MRDIESLSTSKISRPRAKVGTELIRVALISALVSSILRRRIRTWTQKRISYEEDQRACTNPVLQLVITLRTGSTY
ncbi:hypothetical protein O6P43_034446 [Quillaja saponaria]|uniref:Uncharacterized protein n=1 Tax=Quillaja saponaria TaxID=32244 RepID=A0AAD7KMF4_QUISA|nr:hypothetical protein O6P43_034446 [Quillaja saponaria]